MDSKKIGLLIQSIRNEKKWTQEVLADKLIVDRTTVSKWERGEYVPSIEMIAKICNLFNISLNEFISNEIIIGNKIIEYHFYIDNVFKEIININKIRLFFVEKAKEVDFLIINKIKKNEFSSFYILKISSDKFDVNKRIMYLELDFSYYKKKIIKISLDKKM